MPKDPVFWFVPFSQHSQLDCLWLPTPDYATPVWLTGCHVTPLLTRCFSPELLMSSLTLLWAISRFLGPFHTFSPAHHRVICNSSYPNLPREAEDFPRGANYSKHVPLLIYVPNCNQFTMIWHLYLYMSNCGHFCLWWKLW